MHDCLQYLCENGRVFSGMSKGVDVPGDARAAALAEGVVEEAQAQGHLVDDRAVVRGGLVTHAPAAVYELQTAWASDNQKMRREEKQQGSG